MAGMLTIWMMTFGLILARASSFVAAIPYLGGNNVPRTIKAGVALALTCFWFAESGVTTIHVVRAMEEQPWFAFGLAVGREVIIGAALGYVYGLFLIPFRIAGEYISQEMGLTLGTITDPTRPQMSTSIGEFFEIFGVLLLFTQDVHHIALTALHNSFIDQPIGGPFLMMPVDRHIRVISSTTEWGLTLATPVACCLFITSLVISLMSRVAPQMNLMSFGYSIRIIVGLLATYFLWPDLVPRMLTVLQRYSIFLVGR